MRKSLIITLLLAVIICAATFLHHRAGNHATPARHTFTHDVLLSTTPVKDQGKSQLCWAYAMLATIETEHIAQGDSVNLSAAYVARMFLSEQVDRCYLSQGAWRPTDRGTMPQLIHIIQTYGLLPYDSYSSHGNTRVTCRRLQTATRTMARRGTGITAAHAAADRLLDSDIRPLPLHVYMFGMEYTPLEFAHSVCLPDEYEALTSVSHQPFGTRVPLPLADNYYNDTFRNLPIDTLIGHMERMLRAGHPVCWEGDTSEPGFSFSDGVADVPREQRHASQHTRQRHLDTFRTTDDHCMAIVGLAHDKSGRKFFICKNSWGNHNPYGGMMYMSFDYARLKTIAIMSRRNV